MGAPNQSKAISLLDSMRQFDEQTGFLQMEPFQDLLNQAIAAASGSIVVAYIRVKELSRLIDILGPRTLEAVMASISSGWRDLQKSGWTICRISEDSFAFFSKPVETDSLKAKAVEEIRFACDHRFKSRQLTLPLGLSAGIARYPTDAQDSLTLIECARLALLQGELHRNSKSAEDYITAFAAFMLEDAQSEARWVLALNQESSFEHLQIRLIPEVNQKTGVVASVCFRTHWKDPELGQLSRHALYRMARKANIITQLADNVLEQSFALYATLRASHGFRHSMSVEVPWEYLLRADASIALKEKADRLGLSASQIIISIQENGLNLNDGILRKRIRQISSEGFPICLIGYGTGNASLSALRNLPLKRIQISEELIRDVVEDYSATTLVGAIVSMASQMSIEVIADGVSSEGQVRVLTRQGCFYMKGEFFCPELPLDDFLAWYQSFRPSAGGNSESVDSPKQIRTLLLVDDDDNVLRALRRLLRKDGYQLYVADGAREALEILAQTKVDVVLSDQRMPDISGTEFLEKVKQMYPNTVRLMLSGYTEVGSVTEAINQGSIYKFLTKPWDDEQLRANIREAFQRHDIELQNIYLKEQNEKINSELISLNHILEQRVQDKSDQIERDNQFKQVFHEMIDNLPVAVVGVDSAGQIASMNSMACDVLHIQKGSYLGVTVDCLPHELAGLVNQHLDEFGMDEISSTVLLNNTLHAVKVTAMGKASNSSGCLLTFYPLERAYA